MASKLLQLHAKATIASKFAFKHGCSYYKQLMEQNKQYVLDPPAVEKCNLLAKQLFYIRLASIPIRYEVFWKELDQLKHFLKSKPDLKLEDYGLVVLFGVECMAWFWVGEVTGRGFTFFSYHV